MLEKHLLQFFLNLWNFGQEGTIFFFKKTWALFATFVKLDNQIDEFVNVHAHLLR